VSSTGGSDLERRAGEFLSLMAHFSRDIRSSGSAKKKGGGNLDSKIAQTGLLVEGIIFEFRPKTTTIQRQSRGGLNSLVPSAKQNTVPVTWGKGAKENVPNNLSTRQLQ